MGLLFSILFSHNLWAGQRWFPTCSLIQDFYVAPPYDYILFGLEIVLLLLLLIAPQTRLYIFLVLVLHIVWILLDQNRLQPWFYIYSIMLLVLFFYNWRIDNVNNYYSFFIILQICLAAVYVYSGLQKLNPAFIQETYPWFIKPLQAVFSERQMISLNKTGYVIPFYEIALGLMLLIKPIRYIAIPMTICLHLAIVILMGPLGNNYNSVVWPWNIFMILLVILLFSGKTTERYFAISHLFKLPVFYLVLVLFWIMPAFNLFNKWETYLSFSLYSGNNHDGKIILSNKAYENLPLYIKHYVKRESDIYILYPKRWCLEELNAPMYPERRIFDKVTYHLQKLTSTSAEDVKLVYIEKQKIFAGQP
ncbi:MAG: hypothetical protein J0L69_10885 [Bacteroidetes bacterium]|nr:hypothetical protein [Bacteroidota bacterium]